MQRKDKSEMKLPSLNLESKVLLTAAGICIYGILRMTHLIHLSDQEDIEFIFVMAAIAAALIPRSSPNSSRRYAIFYLCWGLIIWLQITPRQSAFAVFFGWVLIVLLGGTFLIYTFSALSDYYTKTKRED